MIGTVMGFVAGIGVDALMNTAVKVMTAPTTISAFTKVAAKVGVVAVSACAAKGVEDIIEDKAARIKAKVEQKKKELEEKELIHQE